MFLPVTKGEMAKLGWAELDIILVTGDAYIDSPFTGVAVIGKYLVSKGFRVGVIPQPSIDTADDITKLGEPLLYWGVTSGAVDSMVANYTASGKPRKSCDFTPNGVNNKRPDRATIVYTGLIRRFFKNTKPIILGGIEASLRRIAHYDSKTEKIRRSILFDAKADGIIYGMGELTCLRLAQNIKAGEDWRNIRGVCYISKDIPENAIELDSYESVASDKEAFQRMFKVFYDNSDIIKGGTLAQKTLDRYLIQNPPPSMGEDILDEIHELDYEREAHPLSGGSIRAVETIRFSVISHRGCFGSCAFCAITVHQGRKVVSRSEGSIVREVERLALRKDFKGTISDIGGATGNMYRMGCAKMDSSGGCSDKACLYPIPCRSLKVSHEPLLNLLERVSQVKGVKKIYASSGVRPDIVIADNAFGEKYIAAIAKDHVSGQLKLAPESADPETLRMMRKPNDESFIKFMRLFADYSRRAGKNQFVSCYFMVAHPGETDGSIKNTEEFINKVLKFAPDQVQIFTPTPSTWATCIYYTEKDPETGKPVYSAKALKIKEARKAELCKPRR